MLESNQVSEPTTSVSVQTATTDGDCRQTRPVAPPRLGSDLIDIVGGVLLGLVLMVILIP